MGNKVFVSTLSLSLEDGKLVFFTVTFSKQIHKSDFVDLWMLGCSRGGSSGPAISLTLYCSNLKFEN